MSNEDTLYDILLLIRIIYIYIYIYMFTHKETAHSNHLNVRLYTININYKLLKITSR